MRKVIGKKVTAGGRFDFFLDSVLSFSKHLFLLSMTVHNHSRYDRPVRR